MDHKKCSDELLFNYSFGTNNIGDVASISSACTPHLVYRSLAKEGPYINICPSLGFERVPT